MIVTLWTDARDPEQNIQGGSYWRFEEGEESVDVVGVGEKKDGEHGLQELTSSDRKMRG